jgi:transaldolase
VANAKIAYARFKAKFAPSGEFGPLARAGARVQRPLWASTSTKNPKYADTMYVDPLIGPHTVNTLPPATIDAVLDHATPAVTIESGLAEAKALIARLEAIGISMKAVTDQLTREGVAAFTQSFEELLSNLASKQERLRARA